MSHGPKNEKHSEYKIVIISSRNNNYIYYYISLFFVKHLFSEYLVWNCFCREEKMGKDRLSELKW